VKKTFAVIAAALAVTAFADPKKPEKPAEAAKKAADAAPAKVAITGDAAKGQTKFKELCASCHGETGKGDGPAAAALNPKPANFASPESAAKSDDYILAMIKEGGAANGKSPLMVAWKAALKEDELQNVAAYVRSLSKTAAAPAPVKEEKKDAAKKTK